MPAGTVEVFLIGAVGIKDTERFGKADPYAVLFCGKQKLRSNTASNQGSKPIWNQKFSFYIDDRATTLQIKVYNHNILRDDDELGSTTIPLTKVLADGKLPTTSYNVIRPSGRVQGEVKLSISFTSKQTSGKPTDLDMAGPYNAKTQRNPYTATPPEPTVKHDPLTGPYGYFKNNSSTNSLSHENNKFHSFSSSSNLGGNMPYPPPEVNAYPPTMYPPVSSTSDPYARTESVAPNEHIDICSPSSDGSSHGGLFPVTPSTSTDYTGRIYVQSPYGHGLPHPAPPPYLSPGSHRFSASMSSPHAYPPPGLQNPSYPPSPSVKPSGFQFDELAGNFGSLKISGNNSDSSSHGSYPGHHTQSFSDPGRDPRFDSGFGHSTSFVDPARGPRFDSGLGHSTSFSTGRPPSGYPLSGYETVGYPPQGDGSHVGLPQPGSYSLQGYEAPSPSFYPQYPYGRTGTGSPPSTFQTPYAPSPYYNAPSAHYVPAGYPK